MEKVDKMAEIKKIKNIVIGSGPSGRLGSLELGKLGEEVLLIERKYIAGTCLNEGCMVVCALTDISRFLKNFKRFSDTLGFINGNVELDYSKAVEKIKETQTKLRYLNELENKGVNNEILYGEAAIKVDDDERIIVSVNLNDENNNPTGKIERFEAENLLIATGGRPFIPNIKGREFALTSSDVLQLDEVPEKLNIIGGGIIATELSNIFSSFGSEVKVIARSKALKDIDDEFKGYLLKKFLGDIEFLEDTEVLEIKENSVVTTKGEFEGRTLIATGRIPNSEIVDGIVELNDDKSIKVNEFSQTSNPHIYAAGDVTGGVTLTPVARMEGISAARNMAGYLNKLEEDIIPQSLTLDMDVSFIKRLKSAHEDREFIDITIPGLGGPDAFWTLNETTGKTKVTLDGETGEIEKAISVSPSSVEATAYLAFLMNLGIKKEDFDEFLEVHPSTDAYYKILKIL